MQNKKSLFYIFLAFIAGLLVMYLFSHYKIEKKNTAENTEIFEQKFDDKTQDNSYSYHKTPRDDSDDFEEQKSNSSVPANNVDELTKESVVIPYIKKHGELPEYYITKSEAKQKGWVPSKGNLCEVAPGKAIGGDVWTNRQKSLPVKSGRKYFEADLNYKCGNRNADRVVFSNDGLVFVTFDHYRSFDEK